MSSFEGNVGDKVQYKVGRGYGCGVVHHFNGSAVYILTDKNGAILKRQKTAVKPSKSEPKAS